MSDSAKQPKKDRGNALAWNMKRVASFVRKRVARVPVLGDTLLPDHPSGRQSRTGQFSSGDHPGGMLVSTLNLFGHDEQTRRAETFASLIGAPHFREVGQEHILRSGQRGYLLAPLLGGKRHVGDILEAMTEESLAALRAGRAGLIVDHSREGQRHRDKRSEQIHQVFAKLDVSPKVVVYITQNRRFEEQYVMWSKNHTIRDRMHVLNYDFHIKNFVTESWGGRVQAETAFADKLERFERRQSIEKSFLCLNYKPRPWRIALLTHLIRDGIWDDGLISFGGLEDEIAKATSHSSVWTSGGPVAQFRKLAISARTDAYLPELQAKGAIFFDTDGENEARFGYRRPYDIRSDIFLRTGFSLITETEMVPYMRRITEKPLKALANMHPAIVFGNHHALQQIRAFGFQTFERWIDESYDEIEDPQQRFEAAYSAVLEFKSKSSSLLLEDRALRDCVIQNARTAMIDLRERYEKEIDPALVKQIRQAVPLQA